MDINSLLSPQDSPAPASATPPPIPSMASKSPSKRVRRQKPSRTPSGLSQQTNMTSSPQRFHSETLPSHPSQPVSSYQPHPNGPAIHSPGVAHYSNGRGVHSAAHTPPFEGYGRGQIGSPHDSRITPPHPLHRQASTPKMEALADLASMQHVQQTARQQSAVQRPSISLQNIPRTISGDSNVSMRGEPSPKVPRTFASKALDPANLDTLNQLEKALVENPFDYYSHVSFISILHQGLVNALQATSTSNPRGAAYTYDLLPVLREAYEAMDRTYSLGERIWEFRIKDTKAMAKTIEDVMVVLELCKQATREEPYSARLWVLYGDYFQHFLACSRDDNPPEPWTDEERMIGREVFTPDLLLENWQLGAERVKNDVSEDSSLVWDRYLQALLDDLDRQFTQEKAQRVVAVFNDRLGQPHATWDKTLQLYSTFNSKYNQNNYEVIMEHTVAQHARVKEIYNHRQEHEFSLLKAAQSGDQTAEHHAMTRYLKWEKKLIGVSSFPIVNGLYERATLRFPEDSSLWEDHVEFLIWQDKGSVDLLEVLERATRHCPWAGSLWSHRILTLEAEGKSHREIEYVKHSATKTGMLEHSDIEELMKVQIAWCGYLRRKAFQGEHATEDDVDIAEVGIRSALESVHEMGLKKYGRAWTGDPQYRLERIHIKFFTQGNQLDEARHIWETLVKKQENSYDFWYRYYIWEMVVWATLSKQDKAGCPQQPPSSATAVLEKGLKRINTMDYPEALLEMYVNHCEQHEFVNQVRSAYIERRRAEKMISIRRANEKASADAVTEYDVVDGPGKRKREDGSVGEAFAAKKSKPDGADQAPSVEASAQFASVEPVVPSTTVKRDREHSVVIVRNLPSDATQVELRQFFTDAGNVIEVTLKPEKGSVTATVEFETPEEADYALMKEAKGFRGHNITIKRGVNTTLFVTNYPAHADEAYLRKLFSPYGQIVDVRLPSLTAAPHRRFCYIQFASADAAKTASQKLDGTDVEGLKIIAKISDPAAKKKRVGANEEGREIYVRHLTYAIKQPEIEEVFGKFGKIERINMPTMDYGPKKGNNRGFCFIAYEKKEDAERAAAEMNEKELQGFTLHVELAKSKDELKKAKVKSEIVNKQDSEEHDAASPAANPEVRDQASKAAAPDAPVSAHAIAPVADRSIGLLNIPQTVNDTRVEKLVEPFGFKKVTVLRQHGGAIVEFMDVSSVGKAGLALEGHEIEPGRKIRVGTVAELKREKAEYRAPSSLMKPVTAKRPVAAGAGRGRGRGGKPSLGLTRRDVGTGGTSTAAPAEGEKKEAKTNDDFRAMLLGAKTADSGAASERKDADGDHEMKQ